MPRRQKSVVFREGRQEVHRFRWVESIIAPPPAPDANGVDGTVDFEAQHPGSRLRLGPRRFDHVLHVSCCGLLDPCDACVLDCQRGLTSSFLVLSSLHVSFHCFVDA
jgi:hypothetical protein